jgi:hypothetical protein
MAMRILVKPSEHSSDRERERRVGKERDLCSLIPCRFFEAFVGRHTSDRLHAQEDVFRTRRHSQIK